VDLLMAEGPSNSTGVQLALHVHDGDLAGTVPAMSAVAPLMPGA
jgi:hypothetical protein